MSAVKHRFTVGEYHRMGEAGIFAEDDRVELIDGEVVEMTPISWRHAHCVRQLINILPGLVGDRYLVDAQNPIALGEHGEPQPDVVLLDGGLAAGRLPIPDEVALAVEVAESSLEFDRNVKLPWYGEAGIQEVWIANLRDDLMEVYSDPGPQGYRSTHRVGRGERIVSATVQGLALDLAQIIPFWCVSREALAFRAHFVNRKSRRKMRPTTHDLRSHDAQTHRTLHPVSTSFPAVAAAGEAGDEAEGKCDQGRDGEEEAEQVILGQWRGGAGGEAASRKEGCGEK